MKKIICAISIAFLIFSLFSCKPKDKTTQDEAGIDTAHNSRNSVDWEGTYTGVIPCADCSGIDVQITLNTDNTYQLKYQYLDKDNTPYFFTGKFTWDNTNGKIILDCKDCPNHYQVGENQLFQLDLEGKPITGELADKYILTKQLN